MSAPSEIAVYIGASPRAGQAFVPESDELVSNHVVEGHTADTDDPDDWSAVCVGLHTADDRIIRIEMELAAAERFAEGILEAARLVRAGRGVPAR